MSRGKGKGWGRGKNTPPPPLQKEIEDRGDGGSYKAKCGVMNTPPCNPCRAQYKWAANERVTIGPGCGYIVLGKDRPESAGSGYGGDGFVGTEDDSVDASRVEIVVGRMSSARGGKGVEPGTFVDNSFAADAARIYVCETTDVDKNFGLSEGTVGNAKGKSAVAIKSDHTRIIGREGIKIVTGAMRGIRAGPKGETNSKGGKLPVAGNIDLIAGNNTSPIMKRGPLLLPEPIQRIQPVTVAYNMRDCMLELNGILDDIMSTMTSLSLTVMNSNFATSTAMAALAAVPFVGAPCAVAATVLTLEASLSVARVALPLHLARGTKLAWEQDYLQPYLHNL